MNPLLILGALALFLFKKDTPPPVTGYTQQTKTAAEKQAALYKAKGIYIDPKTGKQITVKRAQ